ncbi:MAG: DICT sensory domain-containing protein, partial [Cyanobacteria bacterium J06598_3]
MLAGSILHKLVRDRQTTASSAEAGDSSGRTPLNFGVYYKNTLVALCHALEDAVLATKTAPLMVTAFQKGKWYLQEADRYSDLADTADKIVILAAPGAGFREHPTGDR